MSLPLFSSKPAAFTEVKDVPPSSVLIHCRTVVEKKDFVSTGIMSLAEGDMLEVEIGDYQRFELGENVKLTVYSPAGIYIIHSTIVAKDRGALMIINPPENQRKFTEKRENPRVEVTRTGKLSSITKTSGTPPALPEPVPLSVKNISMSGIGFTMEGEIKLRKETEVEMELDLGTKIHCLAEIVRTEEDGGGIFYGARYVKLADDKLNSLRAFILRAQIEAHALRKKESSDKKRIYK